MFSNPGGQLGQNAEFVLGGSSFEGQAAQSLPVGRKLGGGVGWPKGYKTLLGRLPSPEDAPWTPDPSPASKSHLPCYSELASRGRDGSLGRNPLSQPDFPTDWLCR